MEKEIKNICQLTKDASYTLQVDNLKNNLLKNIKHVLLVLKKL